MFRALSTSTRCIKDIQSLWVSHPRFQSSSTRTLSPTPSPAHGKKRRPARDRPSEKARPSGKDKPFGKDRPFGKNRPFEKNRISEKDRVSGKDRPFKPLFPYKLSARLQKLFDEGKHDDAVTMLKNVPLDAQNAAVWNLVIKEVTKVGRYKLAYQLYVDMKRRGLTPNLRTYTTLFGGFYRIDDWSNYTKLLENIHNLYDNYVAYAHTVMARDSRSPEISTAPATAYIKILGAAGMHQKVFDVYYAMDPTGPLAPSPAIFTVMFEHLAFRVLPPAKDQPLSSSERNASDARFIWKQMLKVVEDSTSFHVDAHLITAVIKVLSRGRPVDHALAFDIVREYTGISDASGPAPDAKVPLTPALLAGILWLSFHTKNYGRCIDITERLKDYDQHSTKTAPLLDAGHMLVALKSYEALSARGVPDAPKRALETIQWMLQEEALGNYTRKMRPTLYSFTAALGACVPAGDWPRAARIFELMTGWHAADFSDAAAAAGTVPTLEKRTDGRNLELGCEAMAPLVAAAVRSRDLANMRQCLRIIEHVGARPLFAPPTPLPVRARFAAPLLELLEQVMPAGPERPSKDELRWMRTKVNAERVLEALKRNRSEVSDVAASERGTEAAVPA